MFVTLGSTEIQTDGKAIDKGTPGSFLIYGSHEAKTNDGHIIGRIKREDGSYQNHYTVKVAIPAEQFKSIASSIRHDKPPTTLSIETLGRTMDAGGTYLWDIKNQLPVVAISIHMGGRAISQKEIPPSELLANATRGIESKLGWLIALVATVGVLFLLYKH